MLLYIIIILCARASAISPSLVDQLADLGRCKPLKFNMKMHYGRDVQKTTSGEVTLKYQTPSQSHDYELYRGLCLLRFGLIDHAHDIIQQLPSSSSVSYAHSLIHRFEGQNIGDNGLSGFSNSGWDLFECFLIQGITLTMCFPCYLNSNFRPSLPPYFTSTQLLARWHQPIWNLQWCASLCKSFIQNRLFG
jgi:hypothetical protein